MSICAHTSDLVHVYKHHECVCVCTCEFPTSPSNHKKSMIWDTSARRKEHYYTPCLCGGHKACSNGESRLPQQKNEDLMEDNASVKSQNPLIGSEKVRPPADHSADTAVCTASWGMQSSTVILSSRTVHFLPGTSCSPLRPAFGTMLLND